MPNENASGAEQNRYSRLAGNTLIFAISSFSSKLLTLIVQPFLTYAMAEISDLGLSKLLSQYANLLIPFVSMGMSNALIRFGLDKGNSKKQVFTNGLLTILLGYAILLVCWPLVRRLPDMTEYGVLLYIYVLTSCLRTLCTQFVRSRELNRLVAVDGILCTFSTLMFYVLYLVGLRMGAAGYLLAIICGDMTSILFLTFRCRLWEYVELRRLNRPLWKQMLRFSLPMIPAQISFWVINASDLFFVRQMCGGLDGHTGEAWSGLLSTGYFLPTILNTLGLIFYEAWQLSAVTEENGIEKFFSNVFYSYSSVLFCCAAGILWLCRPLMHVMKANYYYSWHFVPFLTLAAVCTCFNQFLNSIYVRYKKSTHSLYTMLAGAVANCVMNYAFIRLWGPLGATYASFLSLALVFVLRAVDTHHMLRMDTHPRRVMLNAGLLAAEAFVLLAETPLYGLWTGLFTAVIIALNFVGVWGMARLLLPRLLGRRGKALVAAVDRRFPALQNH
ncbi:MAG: lipopolysaccharide biosynthesis protein [Faecalibacterium sp.]